MNYPVFLKTIISWIMISGLMVTFLYGNNLSIDSLLVVEQNETEQYVQVQFNLEWEHSWRSDSVPGNWDAAWVFVKFSGDSGKTWQHASLSNHGHDPGTGTAADVAPGLLDEELSYDPVNNPALGAFFYRSNPGTGTFRVEKAQLRWNYGADGVGDMDTVNLKVFAIEMVYVPKDTFYTGSGGDETGSFYAYPDVSEAFRVTSEGPFEIKDTTAHLYYTSSTHGGDQSGVLAADYPNGYAGFYSMKYSITQQQYVDFLNTLSPVQAGIRKNPNMDYRYAITDSAGEFSTANPYVACNYLSWMDGAAYSDWAGLRPMTELEYEKACRGPDTPMVNEFAWGSTSYVQSTGIADAGLPTEIPANAGANAVFGFNLNVQGPLRVGAFATDSSNRAEAGASYYGIMELSGNLKERVVTVGNSTGRAFDGRHGDGHLNPNGYADVPNWPGMSSGAVIEAEGSGIRGGSWIECAVSMRVSDRSRAAYACMLRNFDYGFRSVRTVPKTGH